MARWPPHAGQRTDWARVPCAQGHAMQLRVRHAHRVWFARAGTSILRLLHVLHPSGESGSLAISGFDIRKIPRTACRCAGERRGANIATGCRSRFASMLNVRHGSRQISEYILARNFMETQSTSVNPSITPGWPEDLCLLGGRALQTARLICAYAAIRTQKPISAQPS